MRVSLNLLLTCLLAAACGHAPVPVEPEPELEGTSFSGVVRVRGALATRESGYVFVSVMPKGVRMPSFSRKYAFDDPALGPVENGERVLRFHIDENHELGGLVPGDLVLKAEFDPDGIVESKEPERLSVTVDTVVGARDIEVVLDPSEG